MKALAPTFLALMVLVGGDLAFAATGAMPCAICETDGVACEDTTSPAGCVASDEISDCNDQQIAECGGSEVPPRDVGHDMCELWDIFLGVDEELNPCDAPLRPYTPYKNCGTYAEAFHFSCQKHGFECRTVAMSCEERGGHAVNLVKLSNGTWQGIDITGGSKHCRFLVGDPFPDPSNIPPDTLCLLNGYPPGCKCTVTKNAKDPLPPDTEPRMCADIVVKLRASKPDIFGSKPSPTSTLFLCRECCRELSKLYYGLNMPGLPSMTERWLRECQGTCNTIVPEENSRPPFDSGALYYEHVCWPQASKSANKCQACGACCDEGVKTPAKYGEDKQNSCLEGCNAEWDCGLPLK